MDLRYAAANRANGFGIWGGGGARHTRLRDNGYTTPRDPRTYNVFNG